MPHKEKKNRNVGFRAPLDVVEAARVKAKKDSRTLSNYILKLIEDDVREAGLLKDEEPETK